MNGQSNWIRVSWMAGALLPLLAGITSAANINSSAPRTNQPMQQDRQVATAPGQTQFQPQLEKAKDFIGAKVVNAQGEQLGKIEDVVLTPDRSGINYVVLSHGDKYFAVPWSQFGIGENSKTFILKSNISKADLDRAPGFDKKNWPAMASENWLGTGMAPTGGMMPQGSVADIQHLRLSKLFGTTVRDARNEDIGRLDNVMIDLSRGKVAFGIVAAQHDSLGRGKDFVAVPWSALNWTGQAGIATVNVDRQMLASLAFSRDNFPNLADPQYSRQLFTQFRATPYWESPSLGFIPGQENPSGNLPPSGMTPPNSGVVPPDTDEDSGMVAPNTAAPNSAVPQMVAHHMDQYAVPYNPSAVQTIHGRVTKVTSHRPHGTSTEELALTVKADDGRMYLVNVGPRGYVDRQNIIFHAGDPVTITGSTAKVGHHDVLVASQIQTSNRTLNLRTPEGSPLWSQGQPANPNAYGKSYGQPEYSYRY